MSYFSQGFIKRAEEVLKGGKGDGHKISEYPKEEVREGRKVEREHTSNSKAIDEIVTDHEQEDVEKGIKPPTYYQRLRKVEKTGSELTAQGREHIAPSNFVFPKKKRYPIHDESHARNALARVSQFGSSSEKAAVRSAVHQKYPHIGED